jgi:hypothetical protein
LNSAINSHAIWEREKLRERGTRRERERERERERSSSSRAVDIVCGYGGLGGGLVVVLFGAETREEGRLRKLLVQGRRRGSKIIWNVVASEGARRFEAGSLQ